CNSRLVLLSRRIFFFLCLPPAPRSPLFPYTTLFRSQFRQKAVAGLLLRHRPESAVVFCNTRKDVDEVAGSLRQFGFSALALRARSEEHTSELQSRENLVCRLLLEKKKTYHESGPTPT